MIVARRVRIIGLVQGVFFRAWTKEQANRLGVSGWISNCPDGSVEAHLEGDGTAVEELIDAMRSGPAGARVDHASVRETGTEDLSEFEVRH